MNVNATVYIAPGYPGALHTPDLAALHTTTRFRNNRTNALREFLESIEVQKSLTKQITQTIEPKYLNTLRNRTTDTIYADIWKNLAHLMRCYRTVEANMTSDKEQQVREMQYNFQDPLVKIFTEVEDLQQLGLATNNTNSRNQLIAFALQIIKGTRDFEDGMKG